jgi:hypothetical protein
MIVTRRERLVAAAVSFAALASVFLAVDARGDTDFYLLNLGGEGTHLRVPEQNIDFLPTNARQNRIGNYAGLKIPSPHALRDADGNIGITLRDKSQLRDKKFSKALVHGNLVGDSLDGLFEVYRGEVGTTVHEFLLPKGQETIGGKSRTIFDCGPYTDTARTRLLWPSCAAFVSDNDRFDVLYHVPRGNLRNWHSIEAEVLAFIRTLIVDCFDAEFPAPDTASMRFHDCGKKPSP